MMASRKHEYNTIDAPQDAEENYAARIIDVAHEQKCFYDNSLSITEMVWTYDFYGIAVFDYGYFGDDNGYKGSGGQGEGGGGGYKVVNSVKPAAPSPFQGAGGGT